MSLASLGRAAFRRASALLATYVLAPLAWPLGFCRSQRQLVFVSPSEHVDLGPKVALFAHFDRSGALRDHVLTYLSALKDAGFSVIYVTNSGRLLPGVHGRLKSCCSAVLVRRNVGYDFGAWREGLERLALPRSNTVMLLLANDSVYGPLVPLHNLFRRIDFATADMWGATESWQTRYHLQSYFLLVGEAVLRSEPWRQFWSRIRPVPSKGWIVRHCEVGLSQQILQTGFRCQALWPYARLVADVDPLRTSNGENDGKDREDRDPVIRARDAHARHVREANVRQRPLNPTTDLWRQLLRAGFPFVKRELLRDNPTCVRDVIDWRDEITCHANDPRTSALVLSIERDLQRTIRNRAP
jgi:hypothetical protein